MEEIDKRKEVLVEAANDWLQSDRIRTLLLGTGVGKSRASMIILEALFREGTLTKESRILILSDSEDLRDVNWREDFVKWGLEWIYDLSERECYQSAYKKVGETYDIVVADEIDFSFTDEYMKFYLNNTYKMLLGLTGFCDATKMNSLNAIAPPVLEYTTEEAQHDGILNKTKLILVEFDLSREKTKEVSFTKGGKSKKFLQSENDAYDYANRKWEESNIAVNAMLNDVGSIFGFNPENNKMADQATWLRNKYQRERALILYNGYASAKGAITLLNAILSVPTNKVLTFSNYTAQADRINGNTFHGKNKKGNTTLADLSAGKIRSVGVCKAINRGKNLVGVNNMIMESFSGSTTQFTQRHGRGCRLLPDQTLYLYVMLPYYHTKIDSPDPNNNTQVMVRRPTRAVFWAETMMKGFKFEDTERIYLPL